MTIEMIRLRREQMRLDGRIRALLARRAPDFTRVAELRRQEDAIAVRLAKLAREHGIARRALRDAQLVPA